MKATAEYVRRLGSGLNIEAGYTDATVAYLKAKKKKLAAKDCIAENESHTLLASFAHIRLLLDTYS